MDAATNTLLFLLTAEDAACLPSGNFVLVSQDTGQTIKTSRKGLAPFEIRIADLQKSVKNAVDSFLGPAFSNLQTALSPSPDTPPPISSVSNQAEGANFWMDAIIRTYEAHPDSRIAALLRERKEALLADLPALQKAALEAAQATAPQATFEAAPKRDINADVDYILAAFDAADSETNETSQVEKMPQTG